MVYMVLEYVSWQYWHGPVWLVHLVWVMQQALWQFFSVPVMLLTLLSPWRQDQISLMQGSFTGILKAAALNVISRVIGMVVRVSVITVFVIAEVLFIGSVAVILFGFLLWPLGVMYSLFTGAMLLFGI